MMTPRAHRTTRRGRLYAYLPAGMRSLSLVIALTFALLPSVAAADAFEDFDAGRAAYEAGDYEAARLALEALVNSPELALRNPMLLLECRKYLGVVYLFEGRSDDAGEQFVLLLREENDYQLDPVVFPAEVIAAFERARAVVVEEIREQERLTRERELEARQAQIDAILERDRLIRENRELREIASVVDIEETNSRGLALLPFGIGQFRNGARRFGLSLAVTQSVMMVGAFTTMLVRARLPRVEDDDAVASGNRQLDFARIERLTNSMTYMNWSFSGGFLALYAVGVVHAQINFVPVRRSERTRQLPEHLRETALILRPNGLEIRLRF